MITEAAKELTELRKRWNENSISTLTFNKEEGELFRRFKQQRPDTWETEWLEVQKKARGIR